MKSIRAPLALFVYYAHICLLLSQSGILNTDKETIRQRVQFLFSPMYRVSSFLHDSTIMGGSIVFTAYSSSISYEYDPRWFVGIYKNGDILWHSDTLLSPVGVSGQAITAIMDLNNDQNPEIVISMYVGAKQDEEQLWIFSWDGSSAHVLNQSIENDSPLKSFRGLFEFVDLDGDGTLEIRGGAEGNSEEEIIPVTYSWNGQQYGKWENAPQPLPGGYLPRNLLQATVDVKVRRGSVGIKYQYIVSNSLSSQQEVDELLLMGRTKNIIQSTSREKWKFAIRYKFLLGWNNLILHPHYVGRGQRDTSFSFVSTALPFISRFFVRGATRSQLQPAFEPESWYQDLVSNSVSGTTLGPADPPDPFVPLAFLDTIASYKHRAVELGWITKTPGIANSLDQKLDNAKAQIQKGNNRSARNILQAFVNEVEALNKQGDKMTSEGYALMKFNAEYLVERLE